MKFCWGRQRTEVAIEYLGPANHVASVEFFFLLKNLNIAELLNSALPIQRTAKKLIEPILY